MFVSARLPRMRFRCGAYKLGINVVLWYRHFLANLRRKVITNLTTVTSCVCEFHVSYSSFFGRFLCAYSSFFACTAFCLDANHGKFSAAAAENRPTYDGTQNDLVGGWTRWCDPLYHKLRYDSFVPAHAQLRGVRNVNNASPASPTRHFTML